MSHRSVGSDKSDGTSAPPPRPTAPQAPSLMSRLNHGTTRSGSNVRSSVLSVRVPSPPAARSRKPPPRPSAGIASSSAQRNRARGRLRLPPPPEGSFRAEGPQLSSLREDEQVSLPYPSADWESESGKEAWAARGRRVMVAFLLSAPLLLTLLLPKSIDEQHKLNHATVAAANYIGDASFALTGSLAAGMEGMDLLGCIIVGFITALGGGTLRELFLGKTPIFWLHDEAAA